MVVNAQIKIVGISGLSFKWGSYTRKRWPDLREKIGMGKE